MAPVRGPSGRFISEKMLQKRNRAMEALKKRHEERRLEKADITNSSLRPCIVKGSRIIDVPYFAQQLQCDDCSIPLSLNFIESEVKHGFASIFNIKCEKCSVVKKVHTSRKTLHETGYSLYDINCSAATALKDTGISYGKMAKLFGELDIPIPSHRLLKLAEEHIGKHVPTEANEACEDTSESEKNLTQAASTSAASLENEDDP